MRSRACGAYAKPLKKKLNLGLFVGNRTDGFALQKKAGGRPMPSSAYFRRQADICLRLALIASDDEVSNRLITMSREYMTKSDALAREADTDRPAMDRGPEPAAGEIEPSERPPPQQVQASRTGQ